MIGTTAGKYRIIGRLGRGGSGMVYRAVDETLGRDVAVKALSVDLAETDVLKRFRAEATTLARLNHPEIATLYELFRWETELLMVMELVCGETLEQLSTRSGPLHPARAAHLVDRILSALEHAHRAGVVHRDMKPANVMVTDAGGVKIMDFGVARVRGAEHVTLDGYVVGTPAYMAPEQVLAQDVDERADLYSVGVVLYRLLAGALPFEADSPGAMLHRQIAAVPTPLRKHRDDLPDWCETLVDRALAKSPDDRFQTAGEFRKALGCATGIVTTSDFADGLARVDSQAGSVPAHISTLVLSREAVSRAESAWSGLSRTYRGRAGAILAVLVMSVSVLVGFVALETAETAPDRVTIAAPDRPTTAPRPAKAALAMVFRTKALVGTGNRLRERDARLVLAERTITMTADDDTGDRLHTVACESVVSINYSRGADPMWKGPDGPAVVARAPGGALRALGVSIERHWITLRTNTENRFVILRVDDAQVRRMLSALEERTGHAPQVIDQRGQRGQRRGR
jgi:serine/threonine-protein kinase